MAYCKMVQTDKGIRYMSGMLVYDERVVGRQAGNGIFKRRWSDLE